MTLPTSVPTIAKLPYAKAPTPALDLAHKLVPVRNTQARLRGRHMLVPDLDLAAYRFRAVVDWIEFRMNFSRGVQVQQLQPILLRVFGRNGKIVRENPGPGDVFTRCTILMQEPRSLARVVEAHQALVAAFGESAPAQITGIEVSIDAYPKMPSDVARAKLLGAMQRTIWTDRDIWTNPNSRPRSVFGRSEKKVYKISPGSETDAASDRRTTADQHEIPVIDGTMVLGARDDDVMIRVMDKLIDEQKHDGTRRILTEIEKRVRIEVTLQGKELAEVGLTDVGSLRCFRFIRLQKRYFQFRLPTFKPETPVTRSIDVGRNWVESQRVLVYLKGGVTALITRDQGWNRMTNSLRKKVKPMLKAMGKPHAKKPIDRRAPSFVAYDDLNRKVVDALQVLGEREKTAWSKLSV